jgi:hypothetical protein
MDITLALALALTAVAVAVVALPARRINKGFVIFILL